MRIVTEYIEGLKVVRGRDWRWGDQDKNSVYGIVRKDSSTKGWVVVTWYDKDGNNLTGTNYSYRIGGYEGGEYDLYYYEGDSSNHDVITINSSKKKKKGIITDIPQFFSKPV